MAAPGVSHDGGGGCSSHTLQTAQPISLKSCSLVKIIISPRFSSKLARVGSRSRHHHARTRRAGTEIKTERAYVHVNAPGFIQKTTHRYKQIAAALLYTLQRKTIFHAGERHKIEVLNAGRIIVVGLLTRVCALR